MPGGRVLAVRVRCVLAVTAFWVRVPARSRFRTVGWRHARLTLQWLCR